MSKFFTMILAAVTSSSYAQIKWDLPTAFLRTDTLLC